MFAIISLAMSYARAEDMHWCESKDYVAYDYRGALHGEKANHELRMVRFAQKPLATLRVPIPDGIVLHLYCDPQDITVVQVKLGPSPRFESLGEFSQSIDITNTKPKIGKPIAVLPGVIFPGDPPPSFMNVAPSNGTAKEIKLSSGYSLMLDRGSVAGCQDVQLKVLLRAPGDSPDPDYVFLKTSWTQDCGGE